MSVSKQLEKAEYEIGLYGFSIETITEENIYFFDEQVKKSMKYLQEKIGNLIVGKESGSEEEISRVCSKICENIQKRCKIEAVNNTVSRLLSVPDNILLHHDAKAHLIKSSESIQDLEKQCEELNRELRENALFINLLDNELSSYELEENYNTESEVIEKVREYLDIKFDIELLDRLEKQENE